MFHSQTNIQKNTDINYGEYSECQLVNELTNIQKRTKINFNYDEYSEYTITILKIFNGENVEIHNDVIYNIKGLYYNYIKLTREYIGAIMARAKNPTTTPMTTMRNGSITVDISFVF